MTLLILLACAALAALTFSVGLVLTTGQQDVVLDFIKRSKKEKIMDRQKSMDQSFTVRVIFPLAQQIYEKVEQMIPVTSRSWVRQNLIRAGLRKPSYPAIFIGGQVLLAILAPFYSSFMAYALFKADGATMVTYGLLASVIGFFLPIFWLARAVKARQTKVWRTLPDFLDLLVISVEAGLGLDVAIRKIVDTDVGKRAKVLRDELVIYLQDVNLGKPRNMALQDMSDRVGLDDLNMLIQALIQTFEMGNSLAHTLRVQSEILRTKRIQYAEERAAKIPVKMVPPIYVFLFPAIFVSIFGPLFMLAAKTVMSIMHGVPQ